MATLKKQLEEAQRLKDQAEKSKAEAEKAKIEAKKAKDEAEQKGYDLGVVETEETLRAEVPVVCRNYCAQTWDEALNRARVEASSELRKAKNIYYPLPYEPQTSLLLKVKWLLQLLIRLKKHNLRILIFLVSKGQQKNLKLPKKYPQTRLQRFQK